jgi:hypothetical protein
MITDDDSLFQQLRTGTPSAQLLREQIAGIMLPDEIHDDVHQFMGRLARLTGN